MEAETEESQVPGHPELHDEREGRKKRRWTRVWADNMGTQFADLLLTDETGQEISFLFCLNLFHCNLEMIVSSSQGFSGN